MTLQVLMIPNHKPSTLYPMVEKEVSDLDDKYIKLITKWAFIHSGNPIKIPKYDGTFIQYEGIRFSGSPENVFWQDFIEPYLKNEPLELLEIIAKLAKETDQDVSYCLHETEQLLGVMVCRVYEKMAYTDQILKGNGIKKGPLKNVTGHINSMKLFLAKHREIIELKYVAKNEKNETNPQEDIVELKPNICGFGLNLNALYRYFTKSKK